MRRDIWFFHSPKLWDCRLRANLSGRMRKGGFNVYLLLNLHVCRHQRGDGRGVNLQAPRASQQQSPYVYCSLPSSQLLVASFTYRSRCWRCFQRCTSRNIHGNLETALQLVLQRYDCPSPSAQPKNNHIKGVRLDVSTLKSSRLPFKGYPVI